MSRVTTPVLLELLECVPKPLAPGHPRRRRRAGPHKKCTYALPRGLARRLKQHCTRRGLTQREVVEQLVQGWVAGLDAHADS